MSSEEDILRFPLKMMRAAGFLKEQTLVDKLKVYVSLSFVIIVDVLIILDLYFVNRAFEDVVVASEAMGSYMQTTARILIMIIYDNDLKEVLAIRKQFWKYDKFGKKFGDKQRVYPRIMYKFIKMYIFFICAILSVIILRPVLFHDLPRRCWVPEGDFWFYTVSFIQSESLIYCSVASVLGFDTMFALIFIEATIQFRLLNHIFARMQDQREMKMCVDHHVFLYEFLNKLKNIYSAFLLIQYFDCLTEASIQILLAVDTNQILSLKVKAAFYILALYTQLSFFCFPVGFLQSEVQRSAVAISSCDWQLRDKEFRKNLVIILQRSQKKISISAGGLFEIDRQAFVNLCRSTFSLYTLLNTLK